MRRRPSGVDERGETLVELLVTLVILSTAVIALVGGIAAAIRFSDLHRKQANAGAYVRAFGEAVQNKVNATPTGYTLCATTGVYTTAYTVPDPTRYTASITSIAYWNGTAFASTCPVSGDAGVQRLSLQVASTDGRATEKLDIVIRRPCRSATDFPLDPAC